MEQKHTGKGNEGENTGSKVRAILKRLMDDGMTLGQIGGIIGRDESTMGQINTGDIKNPPNDLLARLRKLASRRGV